MLNHGLDVRPTPDVGVDVDGSGLGAIRRREDATELAGIELVGPNHVVLVGARVFTDQQRAPSGYEAQIVRVGQAIRAARVASELATLWIARGLAHDERLRGTSHVVAAQGSVGSDAQLLHATAHLFCGKRM